MKTVIFNTALASSNRGDEIIFNSAEEYLERLLKNSYTMYFGTHVRNISLYHLQKNNLKVKYANEADYKFILGTNLLTANIIRSLGQWQIGILDRRIYKNSILMGVGTTMNHGTLTHITKTMYEQILRKDIAHSVRDEESLELLSTIKGIDVINTGCPTLWKLTDEVCSKIPVDKSPNVIITVSGHTKLRNQEKDQLLINVIEKNYDKIYLWVQTSEDENYFRMLNHKKEATMIYSFKDYDAVCKNGKVDYVGTRLHGGIYAMQSGVRAIIVEIDHRAEGIRKTNHINTIKREEISAENLENMINSTIKTEIYLKEKEIREWTSQFPYLNNNHTT